MGQGHRHNVVEEPLTNVRARLCGVIDRNLGRLIGARKEGQRQLPKNPRPDWSVQYQVFQRRPLVSQARTSNSEPITDFARKDLPLGLGAGSMGSSIQVFQGGIGPVAQDSSESALQSRYTRQCRFRNCSVTGGGIIISV